MQFDSMNNTNSTKTSKQGGGVNSGALEESAVPATLVPPAVLLLLQTQ